MRAGILEVFMRPQIACTPELFRQSVVIHLSSQEQGVAVLQKLQEMGYTVDVTDLNDPLLAIVAGKSGRISYYFLPYDKESALPEDTTIQAVDFLSCDTAALQAQVRSTLQRSAMEKKVKASIQYLDLLDVRKLSDAQLADIFQIATQHGLPS